MNSQHNPYNYIIIGAGIAAISAIKKIREHSTKTTILLLSNENRLPYKRTKINKHIALGFNTNEFALHTEAWFTENNISISYENVEALFPEKKQISTSAQNIYSYGKLLLAMGAKPNFPLFKGESVQQFHFVHYAEQVEKLISQSQSNKHYLIIGAGVEGIETADQLVKLNKKVSLIQRSKKPLNHLFSEYITQDIFTRINKAGIIYLEEDTVQNIEKKENNLLVTTKKSQFTVDDVIICAGSVPNIDIIKNTTIKSGRGIIVNQFMQTSDENIFAAGDVAESESGMVTGLWHPAEYQGYCAGLNMIEPNTPYKEAPYRLKTEVFDQYYFSANYQKAMERQIEPIVQKNEFGYIELYLENDNIIAILTHGDKTNAKIYQSAVANNWTLKTLNSHLINR